MVKNDKLDALIMLSGDILVKKNVDFYNSFDTSSVVRPKTLDRKVQRNINKERRNQEYGTLFKYGRRFVAAMLIVCTISFVAIMSVDAIRTAIWNVIVDFFDEYLTVSYVTETLPPKEIEEKKLFYENPEWEKQVVLDSKSMRCIVYRKNGSRMITYTQGILDDKEAWYDNENTIVESIKIKNLVGVLMFRVNQQTYTLSWSDGVYEFSLEAHSPEITRDELMLMAQTIE